MSGSVNGLGVVDGGEGQTALQADSTAAVEEDMVHVSNGKSGRVVETTALYNNLIGWRRDH